MTPAEWAKHPLALGMPEDTLQRSVEFLLTHYGWRWHHETDSRRTRAGFLDLNAVRARDGRLLYAELKSQKGRVRPEQAEWIADLQSVAAGLRARSGPSNAGVEVYLWRPSDYLAGDVERVLR